MNQDIYTYLHQLQQALQTQQAYHPEFRRSVRQLQEELNELKIALLFCRKSGIQIHQLKVENLNGTLNIGLNPFSAKGQQIEDFQVDTETLKVNPETETNPDFYQGILQEMHRYLDEEAYNRILHFEQEEQTPLDEMYRQMMVDDIKTDGASTPYYLSQAQSYEGISTDPDYLRDIIIQAMKQDIDKAFLSFIQHIPGNFRKE